MSRLTTSEHSRTIFSDESIGRWAGVGVAQHHLSGMSQTTRTKGHYVAEGIISAVVSQDIETKKVNINKLFADYWFRVPEYQRSYVWGPDEIDDLLDDLVFAQQQHKEKEYFLGSIVLQKYRRTTGTLTYDCFDLLDGQQRLTTLFMLIAVLRDIAPHPLLKAKASGAIYQQEDPFQNQPERLRIEFMIRDDVGDLVEKHVKAEGGTGDGPALTQLAAEKNISVANMAAAILYLRQRLGSMAPDLLSQFAVFLFQKVIVIYVASETLEDAFRMFTILNARGIPLSNSDILKSMNVGTVGDEAKRKKFARMWEELEGEFGREDFDRFLGHVRTIIVKEKARENLLKEFELIYAHELLDKGEPTLQMVRTYRDHYARLFWFEDEVLAGDCRLRNLISVMLAGLSTDWMPPFLLFYEKFKQDRLLDFLQRLESKVAADWILQRTPTVRIGNTYVILRAIEKAASASEVVANDGIFAYERDQIDQLLDGSIYDKNFAKFLMLKVEFCLQDPSQPFAPFTRTSIEHVLPQNPEGDSQWCKDFTDAERASWVHRLANLVVLSRIKNVQLGNREFKTKKNRYFKSSVNVFPNVVKVMQFDEWTPHVLDQRQRQLTGVLKAAFK